MTSHTSNDRQHVRAQELLTEITTIYNRLHNAGIDYLNPSILDTDDELSIIALQTLYDEIIDDLQEIRSRIDKLFALLQD